MKSQKKSSENEEKTIRNALEIQNFRLRRATGISHHYKLLISKSYQKSHTTSFEKISDIRKIHILY